eukprot:jgi/Picsp_1/5753/NSC_03112-R1_mitochondrial import inner membrane translocase subunit tim10
MSQVDAQNAVQMAQQEMEYRVDLFNRYKDGDLSVGENTCIDRCSSKYWQLPSCPSDYLNDACFFQVTGIVGQLLGAQQQ